ncbi:hypothetical protein HK405_013622 [Cladochytrium tenue]|nr:hypothetical protein HK405_013622 [Cladochytrium tenue]
MQGAAPGSMTPIEILWPEFAAAAARNFVSSSSSSGSATLFPPAKPTVKESQESFSSAPMFGSLTPGPTPAVGSADDGISVAATFGHRRAPPLLDMGVSELLDFDSHGADGDGGDDGFGAAAAVVAGAVDAEASELVMDLFWGSSAAAPESPVGSAAKCKGKATAADFFSSPVIEDDVGYPASDFWAEAIAEHRSDDADGCGAAATESSPFAHPTLLKAHSGLSMPFPMPSFRKTASGLSTPPTSPSQPTVTASQAARRAVFAPEVISLSQPPLPASQPPAAKAPPTPPPPPAWAPI